MDNHSSGAGIPASYEHCQHQSHHTSSARAKHPAVFVGWMGKAEYPPCRILHQVSWQCPEKREHPCSLFQPAFAASPCSWGLGARPRWQGNPWHFPLLSPSRSRHRCQRVLDPVWGVWGQWHPASEGVQQVQQV